MAQIDQAQRMGRLATRLPAMPKGQVITWGILLAVVALGYFSTLVGLYELWGGNDFDYSHGGLLVAAAGWLLVRELRRGPVPLDPSSWGAAAVLGLSIAWFLAGAVHVQVGQQAAFVLLLPALVWAVHGWRGFRRLALPLLLPLWGVPLWDAVNGGWFQVATATVARGHLALAGVPVAQEGVALMVPSGMFRVVEACSGLRQLVVAIPLCLVFAHVNGYRGRLAALLTVLGAVLAFAVNTVRIAIVVTAGHLTQMQHPLVSGNHETLGWALFAVAMTLLLFSFSRLPRQRVQRPARHRDEVGRGVAAGGSARVTMALTLVALAAGPVLALQLEGPVRLDAGATRHVASPATLAAALPERFAGWSPAQRLDYRPGSTVPDALTRGVYALGGGPPVVVHVSTFLESVQGREAVSRTNTTVDGRRWWYRVSPTRMAPPELGGGDLHESVVTGRSGERLLVWAWYRIGTAGHARDVAQPLEAKLLQLGNRFFGSGVASFVVLATPASDRLADDRARLGRFWQAARRPLDDLVRRLPRQPRDPRETPAAPG